MSADHFMNDIVWRHSALARWSFRPQNGGAERQFEYYVRAFSNMSERLTIYCNDYQSDARRLGSNVTVKCLLCSHKAFVQRLNREIRIDSPDIFHSNEMIPNATSIRIGDGVHKQFLENMWKFGNGLNRFRFHPLLHRRKLHLENTTLSHPSLSHIISPSLMCLDEIKYFGFAVTSNKSVVSNVIAPQYLETPLVPRDSSDSLNIIFVGSGFRRKGLELLLRSLSRVNRPFTLRVVGQDSHLSRYQSLSRELGIERYVRWVGLTKDPIDIYSDADLLALPAIYEPAGNVVLEALAMGVKVLVSEFVGCKSFVNSRTGKIVALNENEIAMAIDQIIPDFDRQQIRDSVAYLTERYFQEALKKIYKEVV